jgi:cytochrome c-type biogenesis protein CcmH
LKRSWCAALVMLALAFTLAAKLVPPALADAPSSTEQRELSIERGLACPQCTDLPLDVCTQDICNDMRTIIHEKVLAGESDAAIRQYFVQRYGSRVLLAPPKDSANLFAWIFPFLALGAGGVIVAGFIRTVARRPHARTAPGAAAALRRYRAQIERDVESLE